jgi:oxygen-independent coproporphyrinogen-3 oxidase
VGSTRLVQPYVEALCAELSSRARALEGPLRTLYFGGGTPSMLRPEQVREIVRVAREALGLDPNAELTLEAHPDTVDEAALQGFRDAGINRLSLGVESLDPDILDRIGRRHSVERVGTVVHLARSAGFGNISLDLMYGLPGQDMPSWRRTLEVLLDLAPDHTSLYPLSVEPKTVFGRRQHELTLPPDETVVEMYHHACGELRKAGFEHYEVANWATAGFRSQHNLAYWTNQRYAAVGVGAHGYLHGRRYVNMRGVKRYIEAICAGRAITESSEVIDRSTELDDFLMLGLRLLTDGVAVSEVRDRFGDAVAGRFLRVAHQNACHLVVAGDRVILREEAVPTANDVWMQFIGLSREQETSLDLVS